MAKARAGTGSVKQLPSGRWRAQKSIGSRGRQARLSANGTTAAEALANLDAKIAAWNRQQELGDSATWTVATLLDWFTTEYLPGEVADRRLADTSALSYERAVRIHLRPNAPKVLAAECKGDHIRGMMRVLAAKGLAPTYRTWLLQVLSIAFNAAISLDLLDRVNPVTKVKRPRVDDERRDDLTLDVARRLLTAVDESRLAALWVLMLHIPLRPGELRGAVWADFDLDAAEFRLQRNLVRSGGEWGWHATKNRTPRRIPLPAAVVTALRAHKAAQAAERLAAGVRWQPARIVDQRANKCRVVKADLVFCSRTGQPLHASELRADLERVCDRAGVDRLTPRDLRHLAITVLKDAGQPDAIVQQLAGHKTPTMSDHYTGVLGRAMREALDSQASRLRG
jgi:integrase